MISPNRDEALPAPSEAARLQLRDILAGILATDSRPSIAFTPEGSLILANPAVSADLVARWQGFGRAPGWAEACREAQRTGCVVVRLESGEAGGLSAISVAEGVPQFYLLRLTAPGGGDPQQRFAERLTEMAHDLRAPLQSLIIAAEGISGQGQGQVEGRGREGELGLLAQLALDHVRNLLESLRMEDQPLDHEPAEVFDLTRLVRDMAQLLAPICQRSGNHLVTELPGGPAWHRGVPHLIRAILQNLITNANRFSRNGPVTVRLQRAQGARPGEALVTLEIEDVGPGLTEAERALILSPRRGMRPAGPGEGYGLGFGIVARAVSRLHGQLDVGPGKERGTLFRIVFPLQGAGAPGAGAGAPAAGDETTGGEAARLEGMRILVVEDNAVNLAILLRALTEAGAEAEGVTNGTDALEQVLGHPGRFEVLLLDVSLPDIDGTEVARRIRAHEPENERLVIVGLTAHAGAEIHGSGLAAGMDHIMTKPVRPTDLRNALSNAHQGARPDQKAEDRMESPDLMLDSGQLLELAGEMGRPATLAFMQRALTEARDVLKSAREAGDDAALRARIHSAIGSSGLTGLSGIEQALRDLQGSVRNGRRDGAVLELTEKRIAETALQIEDWAGRA